PWDAAAGATLAFAFAAGVARLHARGLERRARRAAELRASAMRAAGLGLLALAALAGAAPAAEEKGAPPVAPKPEPAPLPTGPIAVYDPDRPGSLDNPEKVFLSYDRWLALWNAANPEQRIEPARAPILATAAYEARIEERVLVAFARYEVDAPDGGLVALPPGAALAGVRVDGRPAAATAASPGGPVLVAVPRSAPGARIVVEAPLRWPIGGREPGGAVKAALPPAPDCRIALVLPLEDPVVEVTAAGGWTAKKAPGGGTRVEAELGPVPVLDLRWSPRGAEAAGGRLRLESSMRVSLLLREDGAVLLASPTLQVASGEVDRVSIVLPDGWQPAHVTGPAVASWTVAGQGDARRLVVRLAGVPEKGTLFHLLAHRPGPVPAEGIAMPSLAIDGAASEEVTVRVAAAGGVRLVAAAAEAWSRVEAPTLEGNSDLTLDPARGESWQAAWRRTRSPSRLLLRTEALPRTLEVDARVHLFLGATASRLRAVLAIRPGLDGLHEARVALPDGWTLDEISGGTPFAEPGGLRIAFPPPAKEARTVTLLLRGPAAGDGPFAVPSMAVAGATRASTDYLVATAPGLAAAAAESRGLDPVPAARFADWPVLDPSEERALAFRDARGGGALSLRREALRPVLRPTVISEVTVLDDRAIVDALIVFEVRGGLAGTFRFRAPAGVRDVWVLGEGLREVRTATVEGREVSTVTLQAPAAGEVMFRALYEIPVPAGGEAVVSGPEPLDAEGARAFLMVRAAGDAEARLGDAPGLDPCDMADLPKIPQGLDPARILRFFRAREAGWRLPLRLVAHEVAGIPDARIHLVDAVTVVDRDGGHRTRVDARLFNRALAFLAVELPAGADLEAVTAAGIPVRPVTRASAPGRVFVPLRRQSLGEDSQTVSVMFAVRAPAGGRAFGSLEPRLPVFPDTPIDATTWRLLLPEDRDYSFSGNLDPIEEIEVELSRAEAYASDLQRLRKVAREGSYAQQEAATENVFRNTEDLRRTLESAQSRLGDLEQAAREGRVDAGRVAESRKKAAALEREINDALKDVQDKAGDRAAMANRRFPAKSPVPTGPAGEVPPDARIPGEPPPDAQGDGERQELARYGTREGQMAKQWESNEAMSESRAGAAEKERRQEEAALGAALEGRRNAEGKSAEADATLTAYKFHADFDRAPDDNLGDPRLAGDEAAARGAEPATPGGGAGGTPYSGGPGRDASRRSRLPTVGSTLGFGLGGGGGGGHQIGRGFVSLGDADGVITSAAPVAGLVSLAPPLVERGRSYAFRKLDAGASLKISPRPADLVVRAAAGVGFLLLVALVALVRRRRAAAAA
ncbi:MAG TPA: hypothetical protein VFS92_08640, partial [Planctomycetota bacterium]|nr:hypothetical protein [Planctomycetota bacterium]